MCRMHNEQPKPGDFACVRFAGVVCERGSVTYVAGTNPRSSQGSFLNVYLHNTFAPISSSGPVRLGEIGPELFRCLLARATSDRFVGTPGEGPS